MFLPMRKSKPEDYFSTTILGAEGFARAFHQIPNVREDMPSLFEIMREAKQDEEYRDNEEK